MALLFMDGCDHFGATSQLQDKWDAATGVVDYLATSGRFGGGAIRVDQDDNYIAKLITPSTTTIVQFALKSEATVSFGTDTFMFFLNAGAAQAEIETNFSGQLVLRIGTTLVATSTLALAKDKWQYVEVKLVVDNASGVFEVKVDGVVYVTFSGDTQTGAAIDVDQVRLYGFSNANDHFYDDVIIMDGTGSALNDYIGDTRIETIYPTVDTAQADFTPLGAGTNFSEVDDGDAGPDDDTSYNESSTVGHKDLFTMGNLTTNNITTVHAVQTVQYARKDDAGARTSRSLVKTGTTTDNGPSQALGTDYKYFLDVLEVDPDTAIAWTESGVNGVEVGYEVLT